MASIRLRYRKDGTPYWGVNFIEGGKQTSVSFTVEADAGKFKTILESLGPERAREIANAPRREIATPSQTVTEWVDKHISHLTGVQGATIAKYRAYLDNDITPYLGSVPLRLLSRDDVKAWINMMDESNASGKTIKNKANFLSGALNAAVIDKEIPANPFLGIKLPEWNRREKVYLTHEEFQIVLDAVTEYWRPLVRFLAASGCRFGEATALRPADVSVSGGTVRIHSAWKDKVKGSYELGAPKSKASRRTIDIDPAELKALDLSGEWVFTNRDGGPVRMQGFHRRVWTPALARAKENGLTKEPRIHDLRHTCASWMVHGGIDYMVVQAHLGHESITTTIDTYTSLDRRKGKVAAEVIAYALNGPPA